MKREILKELEKKEFVSGESLAKKLNVSRTAIWKQIKSLENLGYKIKSVKNKGYKLLERPDIPIPEEIKNNLNTKIIAKEVIYYKKVDSTNLVSKNLLKKNNISEGTLIISDIQTKGKGRKKRNWSSPKGGLWFSIILYPKISPNKAIYVTMISSIAIADTIKEICKINSTVKWPNDVLIENKKVCGILTELDAEIDRVNHIIIGIGINLNNQIDDKLRNIAISVKDITNKKISKVIFFKKLIKNLDLYYQKILDKKYDKIKKLWLKHSDIIGKKIIVKQDTNIIKGIVKKIDDAGCLIIETNKGIEKIISGDLEYIN